MPTERCSRCDCEVDDFALDDLCVCCICEPYEKKIKERDERIASVRELGVRFREIANAATAMKMRTFYRFWMLKKIVAQYIILLEELLGEGDEKRE